MKRIDATNINVLTILGNFVFCFFWQVLWSYIVGMLTNLESLPIDRIHSMLKMFAMQGPSSDVSIGELKLFMDRKVKEQKLTYSGGVYRLPKSSWSEASCCLTIFTFKSKNFGTLLFVSAMATDIVMVKCQLDEELFTASYRECNESPVYSLR